MVSADRCPPLAWSRPLPTLDEAPVRGSALVFILLFGMVVVVVVVCLLGRAKEVGCVVLVSVVVAVGRNF